MDCICCGNSMIDKSAYWQCNSCQYALSKSRSNRDIYNADYAKIQTEKEQSETGEALDAQRWNFVKAYITPKRLLDIGCGSGHFIQFAWRDGVESYGYDVNPAYGFSKKPNGEFDAITLWDTLEHIDGDPLNIVNEFLSGKGMVFISTPAIEGMPEDISLSHHFKPEEHVHYFSYQALCNYVRKKGFIPLEVNYQESLYRTGNDKNIVSLVCVKS